MKNFITSFLVAILMVVIPCLAVAQPSGATFSNAIETTNVTLSGTAYVIGAPNSPHTVTGSTTTSGTNVVDNWNMTHGSFPHHFNEGELQGKVTHSSTRITSKAQSEADTGYNSSASNDNQSSAYGSGSYICNEPPGGLDTEGGESLEVSGRIQVKITNASTLDKGSTAANVKRTTWGPTWYVNTEIEDGEITISENISNYPNVTEHTYTGSCDVGWDFAFSVVDSEGILQTTSATVGHDCNGDGTSPVNRDSQGTVETTITRSIQVIITV